MREPSRALSLLVGLASGAASLAYQVVWDRLLRLAFGADELGAVLVASCFLLGLGLGARIFGRGFRRPLRVYALVELGIGLFGLCSYRLLGGLSGALAHAGQASLADAAGLRLASALGVTLFLCLPCVLMGGTLPLVFACFVPAGPDGGRRVSLLYGANTLGAMLGVALPLALLSAWRVPTALAAISALNFAIAIAAWRASRASAASRAEPATVAQAPPARLLVAAFASGALVLGWELVALRQIGRLHPGSPYNFAMVLGVYLAGLSAGSLFTARATRHVPTLFAGAAAAMVLGVISSGGLLAVAHGSSGWRLLAALSLLVLPFACLQGAVFPALLAVTPTASALPVRTGTLYLASAIGSFLAGLGLYAAGWDHLGARGVSCVLVVIAVGMALWLARELAPGPRRVASALALLALAGLPLVPRTSWRLLALGWQGMVAEHQLSAVEGRSGTATIVWDEPHANGVVSVDGKAFGSLPETRAWAAAAGIVRAQPVRARVLLIGLGSGTVLRALVEDRAVEHIDLVDWSAELPRLLREPAPHAMSGWALDSPKVRLIQTDARSAVGLAAARSYDVIFESLTGFGPVGSTHYRSREYYRAVRRALAPGGALVVLGVTLEDRGVAAAARESFPVGRWLPPIYAIWSDREPLEPGRLRAALAGRPQPVPIDPMLEGMRSLDAPDGARAVRDDELFGEFRRGPFARALR